MGVHESDYPNFCVCMCERKQWLGDGQWELPYPVVLWDPTVPSFSQSRVHHAISVHVLLPSFSSLHRLKKEMVAKVNSVASEFRKVSDLQMAETTKRTIRENVTINQQLSRMSDKTMELLRENEALRAREKDLRRQVEVLEFNEKELTRRNISNQKVWFRVGREVGRGREREEGRLGERGRKEERKKGREVHVYRKGEREAGRVREEEREGPADLSLSSPLLSHHLSPAFDDAARQGPVTRTGAIVCTAAGRHCRLSAGADRGRGGGHPGCQERGRGEGSGSGEEANESK